MHRCPDSLAPLTVPKLRRLLLAQIPSDLADWLDFVALNALVAFQWQLGPIGVASLTLALALPYVVLAPAVGVLVDRADQRTLLVASNLIRAISTAAFVLAPNLVVLLGCVVIKSSADALFTPAKQAALPLLATPDRLLAANSLSHVINQLTKIIGPALGGILTVFLDLQQIFLVNAGLSLIAAMILLDLPGGLRADRSGTAKGKFGEEFADGLRHIRRKPVLATAIVAMVLGYFLIFLYDGLIALLVKEIGLSSALLGASVASAGAGGVIGALLLGQFFGRRDPFQLMIGSGLVGGLLIAVMGHVGRGDIDMSAVSFCALLFATGLASAGFFVPYRVVLQRETPLELLGRVVAVGEGLRAVAMMTAPPLGAALAEMAGISAPYLISGYATAFLACSLLIVRRCMGTRDEGVDAR
ncbi:MFS transporter [Rhizobium sp. BK312]|uniref:MFS transporter n=1 Tax=Rhizobium sp. BK312 TaxID=2587080 RepID=UPI002484BD70|nr:MFS transporter [Rhizobium sp. BK312]